MTLLRMLGIAPDFDEASHHSAEWFDNLTKVTGEEVWWELIINEHVTRENVECALMEVNYDAVVFYDHGDEDGLIAQGGKEHCLNDSNIEILSKSTKVLYTLACLAGKKYGVEVWKRGIVFIGYDDVFGFTEEEEALFAHAAGTGLRAFVSGLRNWKEIKDRMIETFNDMIRVAKHSWTKIWLTHDRDALVVYDGEAPRSRCIFRRLALKLFGERVGWMISKESLISFFAIGLGIGLSVHDFFVECSSPLRFPPHGFWWGIAFIFVGLALLIKKLK